MRKNILFIVGVLFFMLIGIPLIYAVEPISTDAYLSPDDVTINRLESNRATLTDAINNFNGGWILKNTISPDSLKDNANTVIFRDEAFNDWVFTGLLPQTASGLTSNITAGTGYINGERVIKDAIPKTYGTSKWTFVDISDKGTYTLTPVAIDDAEPAVAANSIRLARVVTDGSNITAVRDDRVTSISLATGEDFYIRGFEITMDSAYDTVTVDSGFLRHGTIAVSKTAETGIILDTAADWHDGVQDSYAGGAGWAYIGVDNLGSIKWLGNAPDKSDTSGNTDGRFRYWRNATIDKYWRVIFGVYVNTSDNINDDLIQQGDKVTWNKPVSITTTKSLNAWSSAVSCSAGMPAISKVATFGCSVDSDGSGSEAGIFIRPNGSSMQIGDANGVWYNMAVGYQLGGELERATNSSQEIQHYTEASNDVDKMAINLMGYTLNR